MNPGSSQSPPMIPLAITFYGIVMAVALGIALWTGDSLLYANSHAQQQGLRPLRDVTAGLGVAAFTIAASHLLTERTGWGRRLAGALAQAMGQRSLAECVLLAIVSGVAEEALFRGAIQPHVGLLGASLLFGLAHFAPRRDLLPWTGFALLMGLAFGGLFEWTGNLVAPVMAHAGVNAVNLRLLSLRYA